MESRLLRSHRVIGSVADVDSPAVVSFYTLGDEGFIATRVCEDAFHIIKLADLTVQITSPRIGRRIDALVCMGEWTFVAHSCELHAFFRCKERGAVSNTSTPIESLLSVGQAIIATCAPGLSGASSLWVWQSRSRKEMPYLATSFELAVGNDRLSVSATAHMPTYVNKLLFGSKSGGLELWNVRSKKRVHKFGCLETTSVVSIEPSGVLDVVGVGCGSGDIVLVHARRDEVLFRLQCSVAPTCLIFVCGGDVKRALLVAGGSDGALRVWDLEERRLIREEWGAHRAGVKRGFAGGWGGSPAGPSSIAATTVGGDNSVAQWTFEATDGSCRLARRREGHATPPTLARWYGPPACGGTLSIASTADPYNSLQLLTCSAGDRSVRVTHAVRDALNTELSQGTLAKRANTLRLGIEELRLPPVIALAACDAKDGSWANVVTCHEGQATARCWHLARRKISDVALSQPQWHDEASSLSKVGDVATAALRRGRRATTCCLSQCGNFAIIGHADGRCRKYNVQSGRPRGEYPANLEAAVAAASKAASVAVPGSVTRARREIERKLHKGEKLDPSLDAKAKRRVDGAEGAAVHRRGKARLDRHAAEVTGILLDAENAYLVTTGLDGQIKWWRFRSHVLTTTIDIGNGAVAKLEGARAAGLMAAACDDGYIRIFDLRPPPGPKRVKRGRSDSLSAPRLARRFACGDGRAARDLAWAPDFKTLYAVCGDGSLRVWDVASAALVDWVDFRAEAIAVSVSPTGEFVATAHVGERGIALWTDKSSYSRIDLRPLSAKEPPIRIDHTTMLSPRVEEQDDFTLPVLTGLADHVREASAGSIRLSGKPRTRLEALYKLEVIAERNRPVEPPRKPDAAPFFLPSSLDIDANLEDNKKREVPEPSLQEEQRQSKRRRASLEVAHRCQLASLAVSPDPNPVFEYLSSLEPPAVDAEIALLCRGDHDQAGISIIAALLDHFLAALQSRERFDDVQAYLHRLIQHHAAMLALPELHGSVQKLHRAQRPAADHLRNLLQETLCLVDFLFDRHE